MSSGRRRELLAAMHHESRRHSFHSAMHNQACAALTGVHPTDWAVLDVLCWNGSLPAGKIAAHVGLSNGAVTGALDRLERSGWVRRRRDDGDRRRVIVELLKDRDAEVEEMLSALSGDLEEANAQLTDQELAVVVRYLQSANSVLEASTRRVRAMGRPAT